MPRETSSGRFEPVPIHAVPIARNGKAAGQLGDDPPGPGPFGGKGTARIDQWSACGRPMSLP
jgi:hypothetical protein